jgi:hypothetical protein
MNAGDAISPGSIEPQLHAAVVALGQPSVAIASGALAWERDTGFEPATFSLGRARVSCQGIATGCKYWKLLIPRRASHPMNPSQKALVADLLLLVCCWERMRTNFHYCPSVTLQGCSV